MRRAAHSLALGFGLLASFAQAEPTPTPNANVTRWATGTIAYRVKSTGAVNGYETWRLSVHPDGSRTMAATVQYSPRDIQRHVIHRIDAQLRPLDTYALYWIDGQWRGTALVTRGNGELNVSANTPEGPLSQNLKAPEHITIVPHVLAVDSWRALMVDKTKPGPQAIASYGFDATAQGVTSLLGKAMNYRLTYNGPEQVTVPAGTFASDHFRIEDTVDIYVTSQDAIVVKFVYAAIDREHLLIDYTKGP
ncbi:MAG: hypothetical protein EXR11_02905 [Rhodospirillaceae bacterium]|nr:hypothetical protein [Rhodospirillaceae bacterium]